MALIDCDQQVLLKERNINVDTGPYDLTGVESGALITNGGATGSVTINLPLITSTSHQMGVYFDFCVITGHEITINAYSGNSINFLDSMNVLHTFTTLSAGSTAATVRIMVCKNTDWYIMSQTGSWNTI